MKKMQAVVIHPADEGNVTVILTHDDYHSKHVEMMDCYAHILLNNDPTRSQEKRGWERSILQYKLRPTASKPSTALKVEIP